MIHSEKELDVWKNAMELGMAVFRLSRRFPAEERYSLTDQIRRSSRSVGGNIAEAWRKRRYPASFVSKLNDAEGEAAETQTWIEYALRCGYWTQEEADQLDALCQTILKQLVTMINRADEWCAGLATRRHRS